MKRRKRKPRGPTGLVWREGRAYFDRQHARFEGGRLAISLRTKDPDVASARHSALTQLMDRGDWGVLEAVRRGELHVTDVQTALRDGDHTKLRRLGKGSPRLGDAMDRFLKAKGNVRAVKTVLQYAVRIRRFVQELGRDYPMEELTQERAAAYLQAPKTAEGDRWAPTTQEAVRIALGALWNMVMKEEAQALEQRNVQPKIRVNPWRGLEMPEIRQTRAVFLMPGEWKTLDRWATGQPHRALVALAVLAGLRQGEIRYLRTDVDVELEGPAPLIRVQARKGEHPWQPKTHRGQRDVPITAALVEILKEHIRLEYAGERYLIIAAKKDRPVADNTAMRWVREAFERAGIKYGREGDGLTLHSGRHTFASWLAQDGVSLNVIAKLIGDTLAVTESTYAHLTPDTFRAAVANIERRVGK